MAVWFIKEYTWSTDLANGIGIRADRHDAQDNLFVNGINAGWCVDPSQNVAFATNTPTVDLTLGGFRITNAGDGIAAQDYATVSQLTGATNSPVWGGEAGGTANALTLTLAPPLATYGTGGIYIEFIVTTTNTAAVTMDVNALGPINVLKNGTQQLEAGDWVVGQAVQIIFDGTDFQNLSPTHGLVSQTGTQTYGVAAGTADVITVPLSPAPGFTTYPAGFFGRFKATATNATTTPTINYAGIGAVTITKDGEQPLQAGDIVSGQVYSTVYESVGNKMQLISPIAGTVSQTGHTIYAADTGVANAIAIAFVPVIVTATLQVGMTFRVKVVATNTGAVTVSVGGGATVPLKKQTNVDLAAGDILINSIIEIIYDGTNFQLLSPLGNNVTTVNTAGLATGGPITATGTVTVTEATKVQQQAAVSQVVAVTPFNQQFHPSAVQAWAYFNGTTAGTNPPIAGYNVTSVQRTSAGTYLITVTTAFSSANYCVFATCGQNTSSFTYALSPWATAPSTTQFEVATISPTLASRTDTTYVYVLAIGTQ